MKNKEAIARLNELMNKGEQLKDDGYDVIVLKMAIEALEKQIPKKLRFTTSTKRCSSCGKQITSIGAIHNEYRYCKYCGQAINWSESEES